MQWDAGLCVCWVVGLKVSSAAGGQPLPAQPSGPGSYLVVVGESCTPNTLGTISIPGEAVAGCSPQPRGSARIQTSDIFPSPSRAHVASCSCHSFLYSLAGSMAWEPAGSRAIHPVPLPALGQLFLAEGAQSHGAVSPTLVAGCPSHPSSLREQDRLFLFPAGVMACGFMPTTWGTHSLLLGSSPLERVAWPEVRAGHPECHRACHLGYSQVRAISKISAALPAVLADTVLRSPG